MLFEPHRVPRYTRAQLVERVAAGDQLSYVMFWKPGPSGTPAELGQWQPSPFTVAGIAYSCAEQYMMAEKARVFDDAEMEQQILGTDDPATMKRLGKKVRGFDGGVWNKVKYSIVLNGSYAKFSQDPGRRAYLLGTGDAVLVEASPMDTIWGIGLGSNNPRAADPAGWRGQNLLGFALMEARDEIARVWTNAHLADES
ncbi:MAG: NADAR family protein [Micrococcales bacterium]|nr:NADAR family protein [Micrococcales bacterium]